MRDEREDLGSTAVSNLQALGLSEYAARTLVALTRIDGGSAREVSDASSVPRTRVYDAVEELADRGLVRVEETRPKVFVPVSPGRIRRTFFREYVYRQLVTELGLRGVGPTDDAAPHGDVETAVGSAALEARVREVVAAAETRVAFVSVGDVPSPSVVAALEGATARGVDVRVGLVGQFDRDGVEDAVSGASVATLSAGATPFTDRGRFLVVDDEVALFATWPHGHDAAVIQTLSDRSESDLATHIRHLVQTWLADAD